MLILPAIDLRGGRCVRLRQGDFARETVFDADPAAAAARWAREGARYLHVVDLDGAREGKPVNRDSVRRIIDAADVPCQLGGGLRATADVAEVLGWGVDRVVVGTRALLEPAWLEELARQFPGRIVLGVDARDGRVVTHGWTEGSDRPVGDVVERSGGLPLAALVYTDVSRDGMLEGPNFDAFGDLVRAASVPVIASGGVTSPEDVRRLARLGVAGCIIGRALYEGTLSLAEAIAISP